VDVDELKILLADEESPLIDDEPDGATKVELVLAAKIEEVVDWDALLVDDCIAEELKPDLLRAEVISDVAGIALLTSDVVS
jgi:hypothetical protein